MTKYTFYIVGVAIAIILTLMGYLWYQGTVHKRKVVVLEQEVKLATVHVEELSEQNKGLSEKCRVYEIALQKQAKSKTVKKEVGGSTVYTVSPAGAVTSVTTNNPTVTITTTETKPVYPDMTTPAAESPQENIQVPATRKNAAGMLWHTDNSLSLWYERDIFKNIVIHAQGNTAGSLGIGAGVRF